MDGREAMESTGSSTAHRSRAFESAAASLTKADVERFGRQMLVEEIGPVHMEEIRRGHVVCVGAGGLGSTILLYLAAAGVGHLTVIDFDDVEMSNLHRQVIHQTATIGRPKVESAREACLRIMPAAHVTAIATALTPANAERLFADCDVVVDGTDNVAARYLINDAAMRCRKPLVSGSAMGWDGQLSVYGYRDGPCYRCLFPQPPPPETVGSCNESGVVGPLPGMIGCLQALETLKVLTGVGTTLSGRLFTFNGLRFASRVVTLRGKQMNCAACSTAALEAAAMAVPLTAMAGSSRPEYVPSTCATAGENLPSHSSCTVSEFAAQMKAAKASPGTALVLDVRVRLQYDMAHLPNSICVPYQMLQQWERAGSLPSQLMAVLERGLAASGDARDAQPIEVFVLCRRGINSVKSVKLIQRALESGDHHGATPDAGNGLRHFVFKNVEGGLNAFHARVDPEFPYY